jgi:hypothetical protein
MQRAEVYARALRASQNVLVAHYLPRLFAHLVTALLHLHVHNLAQKKQPGGGEHAGGRGGGRGERKKLGVAVWHGKQEMPVESARVSRTS